MSAKNRLPDDEDQLLRGVVVLNARAVGLAAGVVCSAGLFIATNVLVIKGGETVGPHLALLSQFFIGYHVSFGGSLVGALWAFALGSVAGTVLGWFYNALHSVLGARSGDARVARDD